VHCFLDVAKYLSRKIIGVKTSGCKRFDSGLCTVHLMSNRFAFVDHRNCAAASRNLSAFLASPPSAAIFFGVEASYAKKEKPKSKSNSPSLTGKFWLKLLCMSVSCSSLCTLSSITLVVRSVVILQLENALCYSDDMSNTFSLRYVSLVRVLYLKYKEEQYTKGMRETRLSI
jgi:hypothetical protein